MIISRITSGIGNQMFQYAAGRRLAHKFNTEFKLDLSVFDVTGKSAQYSLDQFNITATIATPEEIKSFIKNRPDAVVAEEWMEKTKYNIDNCPDDSYVRGFWERERHFHDIADIIRKEFTLKNPLTPDAEMWKQKILSAECPVSVHIRHGEWIYNPLYKDRKIFLSLPLDYYYESINQLKQQYKNIKLFVFSNNLQWAKENLHVDLPMEFVDCSKKNSFQLSSSRDVEELHLMSLCKHNIMANSTFSFWGAWLNPNLDKKVFIPMPQENIDNKTGFRGFLAERKEDSPIDSNRWIRIPINRNIKSEIIQRPFFSLLLVVNNDAETIAETLDSILGQDYKYYEVVIIDNASTDGSGKICQEAIKGKENVIFKKLWSKVKNAEAWNMALNMTNGGGITFPSLRATIALWLILFQHCIFQTNLLWQK